MKNPVLKLLFILLPIVLGGYGCTVNKSLSGRDVSSFYNPLRSIDFSAYAYHSKPTETTVYLLISEEALSLKEDETGANTANYSLRYRLFKNYSDELPVDSGHVIRKGVSFGQEIRTDSIKVSTTLGLNYVVELVFRDLNAGAVDRRYLDLIRSGSLGIQDLKIFNSLGDRMVDPYVAGLDSYDIYLNEPKEQLFAKYYDRVFPLASPPFSTVSPKPFNFNPDEVIVLKKINPHHYRLLLDRPGFYQITDNVEQRNGATLFFFDAYFPEPKTVLSLVQPLRYISTNEEFDQLQDQESMKKQVDAYWLRIGDNPERAKELIRAYYERIRWSNSFFTSYIEGWKTDRGMCYIVFGPPDIVYRSTSSETWLYGEEGRYNSLSITFTKVVNPFSNNDFRMNRSVSLKNPWYRAVEFWRQGRVITYR